MMASEDLHNSGSSTASNDRTPLLSQRHLFRSLSGANTVNSVASDMDQDVDGAENVAASAPDSSRKLETFSGVFTPVCLSMFSALLFLRVGFIVGQAGLLEVIAQLLLAYVILLCTVLSISAISTNGAIEGGGAYYMISRTLGPEFGGSIGTLFFFANIFSCALYITGCVEGFVDNFGPGGFLVDGGIPSGRWWSFLYGSIIGIFNLVVCLIGAAMFAKISLFIFVVVMVCTASVIISFIAQHGIIEVPMPDANNLVGNITVANYTGFSWKTFDENVWSNYNLDYTTNSMVDFATVFGVLFSGVTGIMAGANMSGELKEPSRSIPRGTISAVFFTFFTYLLLAFFTSATCSNELLRNNYIYMQYINLANFFVPIGIFSATLSASLSNLIGASRVFIAVAKDELFGFLLSPIAKGVRKDNPYAAVIASWFLVQIILIIGSLNVIAQVTSVFFLLSYCATNLTCLGLQLTSAPNFRPFFKFVTWHTCLVGLIGTLTMMFVINAAYAGICVILCLLLVIGLHFRALPTKWGSISQALIFHQVRKYLLMLDSRKDHVKFWRPQMLLMVANPRSCRPLLDFVNDLKKSGLYILGHVRLDEFDSSVDADPLAEEHLSWLSLVDHLKIKAFVELTASPTVRDGMRHLVRLSGLGAMKPNTILLGFFDSTESIDFLQIENETSRNSGVFTSEMGPVTSHSVNDFKEISRNKDLSPEEYVAMVQDAIQMQKNVCLCRHFHLLDKNLILKGRGTMFIDVWPLNCLAPNTSNYEDTTTQFLLQMACILHMVPGWKSKTILRIFICTKVTDDNIGKQERQLRILLNQLRILATITRVPWDDVCAFYDGPIRDGGNSSKFLPNLRQEYLSGYNQLMKSNSQNTALIFTYLPLPPKEEESRIRYLSMLDVITSDLPPTILIHGISPVISTTL